MTPDQLEAGELPILLLGLFPPALRASALESKEFRDRLGLSVDANIRLDQIGVTFKRSELFKNTRELYASEVTEVAIEESGKITWSMSIDAERARIKIVSGDRSFFIPDFSCLHPDRAERLRWFDEEVAKFGVNDARMQQWRSVLEERAAEDEEVDELLSEFRLTPHYVAGMIGNLFRQQTITVGSLVPDDLRYFDRLVGEPVPRMDLKEFYEAVCGPRSTELVKGDSLRGLKDAFLVSSHPFGAQQLRLGDISKKEILDFYAWLEVGGDRFSQLGGIEWGFSRLSHIPELEPHLERLVQLIQADEPGDSEGRLSLLSSLIVLVEGELARTGICRHRSPYWRRLASIAHASVLERAIVNVAMPPSDFSSWVMENRGLLYYLQTFVDMRREPRWNPDFLLAEQLKAEFIGRIVGASPIAASFVKSESFRETLYGDSESAIGSQIQFPYSFLPGPLEGGVESVAVMPEEVEADLRKGLEGDALTPKSFVTLVNSALIYRIDAAFAELAADGLRRVKHQLRHIKSESEAFHLLSGLATVAAVTRSHGLAEEVRVLMRVVRRKPGVQITQENAMRISMVAAAAHADRAEWCKYVGECITEFSFEETTRRDALILRHHLLALRQLEPQLWVTTARADAAMSAFLQSPAV
jgi:hypothetical protein